MTITRPSIEIPWWFDTEEGRLMIEIGFRARKKLDILNFFEYTNFVKPGIDTLPLFQQSAWALTQIVKTKFKNKELIYQLQAEILNQDENFFEKRNKFLSMTRTVMNEELIEVNN